MPSVLRGATTGIPTENHVDCSALNTQAAFDFTQDGVNPFLTHSENKSPKRVRICQCRNETSSPCLLHHANQLTHDIHTIKKSNLIYAMYFLSPKAFTHRLMLCPLFSVVYYRYTLVPEASVVWVRTISIVATRSYRSTCRSRVSCTIPKLVQ